MRLASTWSWAGDTPLSSSIERFRALRLAVRPERDLLDPRLGGLQPRLAVSLQPVAALVKLDRFIERRLPLLEAAHNLLQLGQRRLETQLLDVAFCHGATLGRSGPRNQRVNGFLMPGTISSETLSPRLSASAAASAASASRTFWSRSARSCSISASRSLSNVVSP